MVVDASLRCSGRQSKTSVPKTKSSDADAILGLASEQSNTPSTKHEDVGAFPAQFIENDHASTRHVRPREGSKDRVSEASAKTDLYITEKFNAVVENSHA